MASKLGSVNFYFGDPLRNNLIWHFPHYYSMAPLCMSPLAYVSLIFKTLESVFPGSGIFECSFVSLPFLNTWMFLVCNHSFRHEQVVAVMGQIHKLKTAWKYAKSVLVPEKQMLCWHPIPCILLGIYLIYINGNDLKQQILMLIHKVLFPDTAYRILSKQP